MYEFRIYVVGGSKSAIKAVKAVENLEKLLKGKLQNMYTLNIIDVLGNPQLAKKDGIFTTPTMVKINPPPIRKIVGDLSDEEKVLAILRL